MALLLDAGALYAQADRADPHHAAVAEILRTEHEALVTSALAVAEAVCDGKTSDVQAARS